MDDDPGADVTDPDRDDPGTDATAGAIDGDDSGVGASATTTATTTATGTDTDTDTGPDPDGDDTGAGTGAVSITRMPLRSEGWIGYTDDAVYIDRGDGEERVKIRHADVGQVALQVVEWDVAAMSLVLVGLGGFVAATRNLPVGLAFAAVGVASLYRTYRQRYELVVHVRNRPKPVTVHPRHPVECHETLVDRIEDT